MHVVVMQCGGHTAPRDEKSFLEKAFDAGHPRTMAIHLSDGVKEALNRNFAGEQYVLMKRRLPCIHFEWSKRATVCLNTSKAYCGERGCFLWVRCFKMLGIQIKS